MIPSSPATTYDLGFLALWSRPMWVFGRVCRLRHLCFNGCSRKRKAYQESGEPARVVGRGERSPHGSVIAGEKRLRAPDQRRSQELWLHTQGDIVEKLGRLSTLDVDQLLQQPKMNNVEHCNMSSDPNMDEPMVERRSRKTHRNRNRTRNVERQRKDCILFIYLHLEPAVLPLTTSLYHINVLVNIKSTCFARA